MDSYIKRVFSALKYVWSSRNFIVVLIITIVGAALRTYNFQSFDFYADSARDILVAKHMVEFDGYLRVSPGASAGWNLIHNSPLYFWLLASLWYFLRSPYLVSYVFVIIGILTIIVAYKIGVLAINNEAGIIFALFISISHLFVKYSRSVWQPHMIPFITLLGCYFLLKTSETKKTSWLILTICAAYFGLNIHYSFIPIFLVLSLWIFYYIMNAYSKKGAFFAFFPAAIFSFLFIVWASLTYAKAPFDQFFFFTEALRKYSTSEQSVQVLFMRLPQVIYFLFAPSAYIPWVLMLFSVCIVMSVVYLSILEVRRSKKLAFFICVSFVASLIVTAFYTDADTPIELWPHYYAPYYPMVLLLISGILTKTLLNKPIKYIIVLYLAMLLFQGNETIFRTPINNFLLMKQISWRVYSDYISVSKYYGSFAIYDHNPNESQFDFYNGQYYYFLENYSKKPLVYISNDDRNIIPFERKPILIYIVCSWYPLDTTEEKVRSNCVSPFQKEFLNNKTHSFAEKIEVFTTKRRSFYIYRFTVQ